VTSTSGYLGLPRGSGRGGVAAEMHIPEIPCCLIYLQDVNVIQEFRQEVQRIREVNEAFRVRHGQVVASHDILGLRKCMYASCICL